MFSFTFLSISFTVFFIISSTATNSLFTAATPTFCTSSFPPCDLSTAPDANFPVLINERRAIPPATAAALTASCAKLSAVFPPLAKLIAVVFPFGADPPSTGSLSFESTIDANISLPLTVVSIAAAFPASAAAGLTLLFVDNILAPSLLFALSIFTVVFPTSGLTTPSLPDDYALKCFKDFI